MVAKNIRCKHCGEDDEHALEVLSERHGILVIYCNVCSKKTEIYTDREKQR